MPSTPRYTDTQGCWNLPPRTCGLNQDMVKLRLPLPEVVQHFDQVLAYRATQAAIRQHGNVVTSALQ